MSVSGIYELNGWIVRVTENRKGRNKYKLPNYVKLQTRIFTEERGIIIMRDLININSLKRDAYTDNRLNLWVSRFCPSPRIRNY